MLLLFFFLKLNDSYYYGTISIYRSAFVCGHHTHIYIYNNNNDAINTASATHIELLLFQIIWCSFLICFSRFSSSSFVASLCPFILSFPGPLLSLLCYIFIYILMVFVYFQLPLDVRNLISFILSVASFCENGCYFCCCCCSCWFLISMFLLLLWLMIWLLWVLLSVVVACAWPLLGDSFGNSYFCVVSVVFMNVFFFLICLAVMVAVLLLLLLLVVVSPTLILSPSLSIFSIVFDFYVFGYSMTCFYDFISLFYSFIYVHQFLVSLFRFCFFFFSALL